jgi:hypothetical protein
MGYNGNMTRRWFLITYKVFFAGLIIAAIITQLKHSLALDGFSIVNFFSYFTIQSNIFAAVMLLMTADLLFWKRKRDHEQEMLRGAAALYMVVTGIVYALLLSDAKVQITLPWVNDVLHRILPLVMLFDWLYDGPQKKILPKQSLLWLIYPVIYLIYTLTRGPFAHDWYPYPFINVAEHGYAAVLTNSIVLAVAIFALAQIVARLPGWISLNKR